jgi:uncharacterized protein YigA (DUF484 family)
MSDSLGRHRYPSKMPRHRKQDHDVRFDFASEMKEAESELAESIQLLDKLPTHALEDILRAWNHADLAYVIYDAWDEDEAREGASVALWVREDALLALADRLTSEMVEALIEERKERAGRINTPLRRLMERKLGNNSEPGEVSPTRP